MVGDSVGRCVEDFEVAGRDAFGHGNDNLVEHTYGRRGDAPLGVTKKVNAQARKIVGRKRVEAGVLARDVDAFAFGINGWRGG